MMKAHAKVNLFLTVGRKDERGYHPLKTVFQPLTLHDKVKVEQSIEPGIHISSNRPDIPTGKGNTAYKAVEIIARAVGKDLTSSGVRIHIEKYIPLSSGLGGSAIDAAPVLTKLNILWELGLSISQLERLGAQVGADVPQAIRHRTCYAEGYGDAIRNEFRLDPIHVCVAIPCDYMSSMNGRKTTFLYEKIDEVERPPVSELPMLIALHAGRWEHIAQAMHNDFEAVAFRLHPELKSIKMKMIGCGALGALLSGSGGAVFGLFNDRAAITRAVEALAIDNSVKMIFQKETL
jgi:4-diphosphocytidyl-2-C-methyl-D-erythritol kinase